MAFHFPNAVPKFPPAVKGAAALQERTREQEKPRDGVLSELPPEDQELIVQLVLLSGSLKELAAAYDVSYPTIRLRLDRVIERLRVVLAARTSEGLSALLSRLIEQGQVSADTARVIEDAARAERG
ncbi:MAG: DUF2089 family protein [Planctomycetes bacterium]|nr:DUF2089 family protein [Planctomycetota bacterium]